MNYIWWWDVTTNIKQAPQCCDAATLSSQNQFDVLIAQMLFLCVPEHRGFKSVEAAEFKVDISLVSQKSTATLKTLKRFPVTSI